MLLKVADLIDNFDRFDCGTNRHVLIHIHDVHNNHHPPPNFSDRTDVHCVLSDFHKPLLVNSRVPHKSK
jgi:hypothetical protein